VHKELTELQAKFLDALFGPAKGNQAKAMKMAGYSETTNPHHIVSSLRSEIIERAELEMAANAPKAVLSMVGVIDDPSAIGNRERLAASQQILDRVGLSKVEKLNVSTDKPMGVFILPAKTDGSDSTETESNE
jgi:hypothetical protein|tara:strand:+ start:446 stop:844 length:399 start_codon:yes stop_codon:yes gene_type:complete